MKLKIRRNTILLWIIFTALLFFAGFRWDVGIDWFSYMSLFGNDSIVLFHTKQLEFGNIAIKLLLNFYGYEDGGYWLWIMAFITLYFFFYSIWKYSVNPIFSVILFVCLGMYFDLLNGVRQYAAIALVVYSWQYILDKKIIPYIIMVLVASLFHSSAFLMLPFYFISSRIYNKKTISILVIVAIPLSFFISPVINTISSHIPLYEVYTDSQFISTSNPFSIFRIIFPLSLFAISLPIYDKLTKNRNSLIFLNLSIFSIFITLLFPGVTLMIRVGFYFQLAFIFLIPNICKILDNNNSIIFKWFSIIYGLTYIYVTLISRPVSNIIPFTLDLRLADIHLLNISLITLLVIWGFMYLINAVKKL